MLPPQLTQSILSTLTERTSASSNVQPVSPSLVVEPSTSVRTHSRACSRSIAPILVQDSWRSASASETASPQPRGKCLCRKTRDPCTSPQIGALGPPSRPANAPPEPRDDHWTITNACLGALGAGPSTTHPEFPGPGLERFEDVVLLAGSGLLEASMPYHDNPPRHIADGDLSDHLPTSLAPPTPCDERVVNHISEQLTSRVQASPTMVSERTSGADDPWSVYKVSTSDVVGME